MGNLAPRTNRPLKVCAVPSGGRGSCRAAHASRPVFWLAAQQELRPPGCAPTATLPRRHIPPHAVRFRNRHRGISNPPLMFLSLILLSSVCTSPADQRVTGICRAGRRATFCSLNLPRSRIVVQAPPGSRGDFGTNDCVAHPPGLVCASPESAAVGNSPRRHGGTENSTCA